MNAIPLPRHPTIRLPLALATLLMAGIGFAQVPVDEDGNPYAVDVEPLENGVVVENPVIGEKGILPVEELETLVGPIALYPDDLLAIVLPASTYPLEIVQAARFLDQLELDPSLTPDEEWDDSVIALLNYPDVLRMMNEDIDWTWKLGEAIVSQQADVILAIESFRDRAYAAGNLKSDEYQTVSQDNGIIEIDPVEDDVIYVPYYEPSRVVTYSPTRVYHYYSRPYPVYYYPYAHDHYFVRRPFWGVTTAFTIGWTSHRLHVYHPTYVGHPYYGYNYLGTFWRRPSINIYNSYYADHHSYTYYQRSRHGDRWRPRYRSGARPRQRTVRSGYAVGPDGRGDTVTSRNSRNGGSYRDRRTDGLDYNHGARPRANNSPRLNGGSRDAARSPNRTNRRAESRERRRGDTRAQVSEERPAVTFRPRGDGAFSGRRSPRVERNATNRRAGDTAVRGRNTARQPVAGTTRRAAPDRPRVNRTQATRPQVDRAQANRAQANRGQTNRSRANRSAAPNRSTTQRRTTVRQPSNRPARQSAPRTPSRQSAAPARSAPRSAAGNSSRRSASPAPRRSPTPRSNGGNRRDSVQSSRRSHQSKRQRSRQ